MDVNKISDISNCFVVVSSMEVPAEDMDKSVMEVAAATRRNPLFIARMYLDPNENTSSTSTSPFKRMTSSLQFPVVYLRLRTFGFVFTRHSKIPRRGILLPNGHISYKDPDRDLTTTIRIAYNSVYARFILKEDGSPDMKTEEAHFMQTFLDFYGLKAVFVNGNDTWGSVDPKTGKWTGVVGLAVYQIVDIGVSFIGFTSERASVVDYSHYVGDANTRYFTKYPELLSPAGNIAKVFDGYSWLLILTSSAFLWIMIYIVSIYSDISGKAPDFLAICMYCNPMFPVAPNWFTKINTKKGTLAILLVTVNLTGVIMAKAFGCNLNAILLKSEISKAIDYPCDIVEQKKTLLLFTHSWRKSYLETSSDPCQREAVKYSEDIQVSASVADIYYRVATESNAILIGTEDVVMGFATGDSRYEALPKPWFYWSKGTIRPYYTGWVMTKNSVWKGKLDKHLLRCHQAGIETKLARMNKERFNERENSSKPMSLEHFVVGFIIIVIGFTGAFAAFCMEMVVGRKAAKKAVTHNLDAVDRTEAASQNITTVQI